MRRGWSHLHSIRQTQRLAAPTACTLRFVVDFIKADEPGWEERGAFFCRRGRILKGIAVDPIHDVVLCVQRFHRFGVLCRQGCYKLRNNLEGRRIVG